MQFSICVADAYTPDESHWCKLGTVALRRRPRRVFMPSTGEPGLMNVTSEAGMNSDIAALFPIEPRPARCESSTADESTLISPASRTKVEAPSIHFLIRTFTHLRHQNFAGWSGPSAAGDPTVHSSSTRSRRTPTSSRGNMFAGATRR
jgi:hypothetical protein